MSVVVPLDAADADLALVGGKGASLARLAGAGLPVPPGFDVTTAAYWDFVAAAGLREPILAAVAAVDVDRPETARAASERIQRLFAESAVPVAVAEAICEAYAAMGAEVAVAVRSSATAEDLPEMSFAGQQDTFLNVRGGSAVVDAVRRCWASLWTARAIDYRLRNGVAADGVALAVVVQELVAADAAGVLFTRDPVTGGGADVVVNAAWGLGESIVGGQVTPDTYVVARGGGLRDQVVGDKAVMTVRADGGTREVAVSADRRGVAVLSPAEVGELAELGVRIEELYGRPMDVEWAVRGGRFWVVQARPITGLRERPVEVCNDSLAGDYLWTCANLGEAIPSVMTPCTWSLVEIFMSEAMSLSRLGPHRLSGNIGGRFYLNLSLTFAAGNALGLGELARGEIDREAFVRRWGHRCPDEFEVSVPRPAEDPEWIDRQLAGCGCGD
ncbi:PEP/pyruvate-binding domain-containing protein [Saccharopolyspora sp. 5N708]|uniref:PEP/pyruvate-binding domain-containing protein n=1 Tax=Saccharopolyspora sp. 5N708 TaxID=3457424 RepID=UPI003FD61A9D